MKGKTQMIMTRKKRIFSVLFVCCMLLTLAPITLAVVEECVYHNVVVTENAIIDDIAVVEEESAADLHWTWRYNVLLRGTVTNAETGQQIPNATVTLFDRRDEEMGPFVGGAYTNYSGFYEIIARWDHWGFFLQVEAEGFETQIHFSWLSLDRWNYYDIELSPSSTGTLLLWAFDALQGRVLGEDELENIVIINQDTGDFWYWFYHFPVGTPLELPVGDYIFMLLPAYELGLQTYYGEFTITLHQMTPYVAALLPWFRSSAPNAVQQAWDEYWPEISVIPSR